ncbi:MAG: RNA polymerase sigma factor [Anaerolineae bacterium]|nr:RNA polymerase sigma factor [Anaerolineae bacterium]
MVTPRPSEPEANPHDGSVQGRPDTNYSDLELAQKVAAGDPQALEVFYQRYFTRLYRFVYCQVGGSHEDAQDVLQDALLAALKSLGSYRGDSTLYSWLCGVAWNKAADFRRREYRVAQVEQRSVEEVRQQTALQGVPLPDNVLVSEENRERVHQTLRSLPEHYRQVLVLKYAEELPVEDIAHIMRRTFKSTESLLTRARSAFRESYLAAAAQ